MNYGPADFSFKLVPKKNIGVYLYVSLPCQHPFSELKPSLSQMQLFLDQRGFTVMLCIFTENSWVLTWPDEYFAPPVGEDSEGVVIRSRRDALDKQHQKGHNN
jgi:hypothetical protein